MWLFNEGYFLKTTKMCINDSNSKTSTVECNGDSEHTMQLYEFPLKCIFGTHRVPNVLKYVD